MDRFTRRSLGGGGFLHFLSNLARLRQGYGG